MNPGSQDVIASITDSFTRTHIYICAYRYRCTRVHTNICILLLINFSLPPSHTLPPITSLPSQIDCLVLPSRKGSPSPSRPRSPSPVELRLKAWTEREKRSPLRDRRFKGMISPPGQHGGLSPQARFKGYDVDGENQPPIRQQLQRNRSPGGNAGR